MEEAMKPNEKNTWQLAQPVLLNLFREEEERWRHDPTTVLPAFKRELLDAGFEFELLHQSLNYLPACIDVVLPIAVKYFCLSTSINEKQYIRNWFSFRGCTLAVPPLLHEIEENMDKPSWCWELGDTLLRIRDESHAEEYLAIVKDKRYGIGRQNLVLLLGRIKYAPALQILIELLNDQDAALQAMTAISCFKSPDHIRYLEPFLSSHDPDYRKQAEKAIARIRKAAK